MLGQIKFAWWRERLGEDPALWPNGEPLLATLGKNARQRDFATIVEGWEPLLDYGPLDAEILKSATTARAGAFAAVADPSDHDVASKLAFQWACADLALRRHHAEERAVLAEFVRAAPISAKLPRTMRPLVVLHGLALRRMAQKDPTAAPGLGAFLAALRLGLLGR